MRFEGDNMTAVRRNNRAAVLRCLHESGGLSRKKLSESVGLTQAAITKITRELIAEGLVSEGAAVQSGGAGRREVTLTLRPDARCALGVMIEPDSAVLSAVRLDGTVLCCETADLLPDPEKTVKSLSERLLALTEAHRIPLETVVGTGVAVRGRISSDARSVRNGLGAWREEYPLCERFEAYTGLPALLENNVRAMLAAQLFLSRDTGLRSQFFLRCEYGIGAALSIQGEVFRGDSEQCAEIGHIPAVRRGGKPCACGKSGCLETIASPGAIREEAIAALSLEQTPLLWRAFQDRDVEELSVFDVLTAASNGDAGASAIVDRAIQALGTAVKALIYLVDPGKIILYGSLFEDPYYLSRLSSELQEGVDMRHDVVIEKSRYNQQLEDKAACLLAVQDFMDNGGIQE